MILILPQGLWNLILLRTLLRLENTRAKIIQENIIIGDIPNHKYGFWAYSSTKKPFIITTTAEALQYIKKERDYVIYDVDHTKELQQRVEKLRTGTMSAALADESNIHITL